MNIQNDRSVQILTKGGTAFAFALFSEINKQATDENVFISPFSVALALSMALNGARGDTRQAIVDVLSLDDLSQDQINAANLALQKSLADPGSGINLEIANSLWVNKDITFKDEFLSANRDHYGAEATSLDFADCSAVEAINRWVASQTNGRISQIVAEIPPLAALYLINAVFFKAAWFYPFSPFGTTEAPFHLPDGSEKPCQLMTSFESSHDYFRGKGFQAVKLKYRSTSEEAFVPLGRTSMYLLLPDEDSSLGDLQSSLTLGLWETVLGSLETDFVRIRLPRVSFDYQIDLANPLGSLGMGVAFDRHRADLSGMSDVAQERNIYVSKVTHKTFLEIDEAGTEAGAATSLEMLIMGIAPEPRNVVFDRPFLLVIGDDLTGTVLFVGAVVDPA